MMLSKESGRPRVSSVQPMVQSPVNVYIDITAYAGYDPETTDAVGRAAEDYLRSLRIGQSLVVPRLYTAYPDRVFITVTDA